MTIIILCYTITTLYAAVLYYLFIYPLPHLKGQEYNKKIIESGAQVTNIFQQQRVATHLGSYITLQYIQLEQNKKRHCHVVLNLYIWVGYPETNQSKTLTPTKLTTILNMGGATFQWVYQSGTEWMPFDGNSNLVVENMWRRSTQGRVFVNGFWAYVNTGELFMVFNNMTLVISRRGY